MNTKKAVVGMITAFAAMLLLAGCSPISEGYITKKEFTPAHSSTWTWCHMVGKITMCQPMTTYYDDEWTFDIKKGKETGFVDVNKQEYNSYSIGDYYSSSTSK